MRGDGATGGEGGFDGPSRCQPHDPAFHTHVGICMKHPHKCLVPRGAGGQAHRKGGQVFWVALEVTELR